MTKLFLKSLLFPLFLASLFLSSCGKDVRTLDNLSFDKLKPEITDVVPKIRNIDLKGVELEFSTEVANPYPADINTSKFTYTIEVMGKEFMKGESEVKTHLKASGKSTFSFPVRIEFLKVAELAKRLKTANEASFLLKGSLDFPFGTEEKIMRIPVKKAGKFPIFRMPEFHNVRIDSTDPSLFNIGVTVKADLKNPNAFTVGINGLRYALLFGDVVVGELKAETDRSIEPGRFGKLTIEGKISAAGTIMSVLNGESVGTPRIETSGYIETPYGKVKLKELQKKNEE